MREPTAESASFGLVAEFDDAEGLVAAVRRAREEGLRRLDAFSPFPIESLDEALDIRDRRVPLLTLAGGIVGAVLGTGMQVATNLAYPIDIGGRPLIAPQAFILITVELAILCAVLFAIVGMFRLNHLPRLNHPLFGVEGFERASTDRFFLLVLADDPRFDEARTRGFLQTLQPRRIQRVGHTEAPE